MVFEVLAAIKLSLHHAKKLVCALRAIPNLLDRSL